MSYNKLQNPKDHSRKNEYEKIGPKPITFLFQKGKIMNNFSLLPGD